LISKDISTSRSCGSLYTLTHLIYIYAYRLLCSSQEKFRWPVVRVFTLVLFFPSFPINSFQLFRLLQSYIIPSNLCTCCFCSSVRLRLLLEVEIYSATKVGSQLLLLIGLLPTKYGNLTFSLFFFLLQFDSHLTDADVGIVSA
jgi:hypothetical protein